MPGSPTAEWTRTFVVSVQGVSFELVVTSQRTHFGETKAVVVVFPGKHPLSYVAPGKQPLTTLYRAIEMGELLELLVTVFELVERSHERG